METPNTSQKGFKQQNQNNRNDIPSKSTLDNKENIMDQAQDAIETSAKNVKEKTKDLQSDLADYLNKNPIKTLTVALAIGYVAAILMRK